MYLRKLLLYLQGEKNYLYTQVAENLEKLYNEP